MFLCEICKREFKEYKGFCTHIVKNHEKIEKYVNKYPYVLKQRLMRFIVKDNTTEKWLWIGCKSIEGYGCICITFRGKQYFRTHRLLYVLTFGSIPEGMCVCYKNDDPSDVNPWNMFLGSNSDNAKDSMEKGRKKHSYKTKKKISENHADVTGINNPNWRGGKSKYKELS